jgi:NSS family neurotransmitter:Na+ symporter
MQHAAPQAIERIRPTFKWVGWWAVLGGFIIVTFYAVVMAWCLECLVHSFNPRVVGMWQDGKAAKFFVEEVLRTKSGLGAQPGKLVLPIVGYLAVCWAIIFLLIHKGVKQVGKVVLITVPLPILLVLILFFRGITLEGAVTGLQTYLRPDWDYLLQPSVWRAAYGQIFFSLSVGFGVMVAYASYLDRKADITNNAFMTGLINCGFSFFAGFAVFSVLGYLSVTNNDPEMLKQGGGSLAFIAYPTALGQLPWTGLFSVMFFVTLLTLGIDSAFSIVEAITAAVMEKFNLSRHMALLIVCILGFGGGLVFCTQNGDPYLTATNKFIDYAMIAVALALCIIIGWFFGARKMRKYINSVSDIRIGAWWDALIVVIAPLILTTILVWNIVDALSVVYPQEEAYKATIELYLGWLPLIGSIVLATILMALNSKYGWATTASMIKVNIWLAIIIAGAYFYPRYPEWVMCGFSCIFLYGGLWYCIHRARKAKRAAAGREAALAAADPPGPGEHPHR